MPCLWDYCTWWQYMLGYGFAVFLPILAVDRIGTNIWRILVLAAGAPNTEVADNNRRRDLGCWVGIIERVLFVSAFLIEEPEFIGVWLALKVAGGWQAWGEDRKVYWVNGQTKNYVTVLGRHVFNIFLIGNGLSVLNSLVGARLVLWLTQCQMGKVYTISVLTFLFTCAFCVWTSIYVRKGQKRIQQAFRSRSKFDPLF